MSPQHKNNSTNFKTSLQSITSAVTAMKGIKAGAYIGSNGLFDSATVNAYRASIKGLSATQAEAALSASGLNAAQRQQILTSKESTVANAGQATSFNVLTKAVWANVKAMAKWLVTTPTGWITLAIGATVGLITAYNNVEKKQNELIENARNLQEEYRSFAKDTAGKITSLEGQAEEFNKLAKGVDKYGNNISLASDEYDRYKSIVAEILGYSPELIQGYDAEGNAIADKNGLLERSIELLKEEQRLKLKEMTTDEKTGEAYDAAKAGWQQVQGYEGANTRNEIARWFDDNALRGGVNYEVDIAKVLGIKDEWKEEGNNLQNAIINNIDTVVKNIKDKKAELLAISDSDGNAIFSVDEIDSIIDLSNDWQYAYNQWQQDIEDAKHGMDDQFDLYAQRAKSYNDLTDAQKVFVNEYIRATGDITDAEGHLLSEDKILEKAKGYEKFVNEFAELNKLGEGGSVDLTFRPEIDTEELNKKGWEAGEGFATVFSSAISNTDFDDLIPENAEDTVAINFTPIIVDPNTGEFKGVLSEEELYAYAHDVLAGVREDDLNLQIGAKFEGKNAIDEAVADGERIHYLHEKLFINNDTVDSWEELRKVLVKTGDDAVQAGKNANEMTVSIGDLEKASDGIKTLGSAFKEISDDGHITTKTLGEIKTATGLADDEWANYESTLLKAKKGSSEFNQAMSELTYKILEHELGEEKLANATEEQIAAVLRENGVLNANAVAESVVIAEKNKKLSQSTELAQAYLYEKIGVEELVKKTEEEIAALLTEANIESTVEQRTYLLAQAKEALRIKTALAKASTAEQIVALATEAGQAGITGNALNDLILDMGIFNNTNLDVSQKVAALQEMGYYANWVAQGLANIDSVKKHTVNGKDYIASYDKDGKLIGIEEEKKIEVPKVEIPKITIPNYSGVTSGGKSGSDNKPDYEDPTDAIINRINLKHRQLAQQEEEIQNLNELAELEEDNEKQFSLTNDLISERKKRLDELNNANWLLQNEAEYQRSLTPEWNEEEWFNSLGEPTEAYIKLINDAIKSGATDEYISSIKTQFDKLSKYKKAYIDNAKEISNVNKEIAQDEKNKWDIGREIFDKRLQDSKDYIEEQNRLGWRSGDNIIAARSRILDWMNGEFSKRLFKSEEERAEYVREVWRELDDSIRDDAIAGLDRYISKLSDTRDKYNEILDDKIAKENALLDTDRKLFDVRNVLSDTQWEIDTAISDSRISTQYLNEEERKRIFNDSDYAKISKEIKDIDKLAAEATSDYQRKINNAWRNGEIYLAESLVSEHEQLMEFYERRLEISKAEVDLAKKKNELENALANRNIRQLVERNGKLEWEWVADNDKVRSATENLMNSQHSLETLQNKNDQELHLDARERRIGGYQNEQEKNNAIVEENSKRLDLLKKAIEDITTPLDTIANLLKTIEVLVPEANSYTQGLSPLSKNLKVDADGGYWSKEKSQSSNSIRLSDMPVVDKTTQTVRQFGLTPIFDDAFYNFNLLDAVSVKPYIPPQHFPNISIPTPSQNVNYNLQGDIVVVDTPDVNGLINQITSEFEKYTN